MNPHNHEKASRLTEAVRDLQQPLPLSIRSELQQARAKALAQRCATSANRWQLPGWSMAALASLAVVTISLMSVNNLTVNESQPAPAAILAQADLAIINAPDDLAFYRDLEFVQWLESEGSLDQHGS